MFALPIFSQTYITNVTVADVINSQFVTNQTVVITGDQISDIQDAEKIKIPSGAEEIDGAGKYLIPGLTDAHVHFFQSGGLYTRPDVIDLRKFKSYEEEIDDAHEKAASIQRRYLQNGITDVIDVGASYRFLDRKEEMNKLQDGAHVMMTGPLLTTYEPAAYQGLEENSPFSLVMTAEEGREMVQEQLKYNPDFIKIWYIARSGNLGPEASARKFLPIVKAVIDEAHAHGLKVAVHATERITAQLAVENGCDFLVHSVEDEIIDDEFVNLLKTRNVVLCPTLTVHHGYDKTLGQKLNFKLHDFLKADPDDLGSLLDLQHLTDTVLISQYKRYINSPAAMANAEKEQSIGKANLKKLVDADVLIATGTDAGNIGTLHASSYLAELEAMKESGMNNWQILQASTINGAKILDQENEKGSVTTGKKANLVLLNANPITQLGNISDIALVIKNGMVFSPDTLIQNTPSALAQRQLNGYNSRNIEAFLEPYAEDVEIYSYPDKLLFTGKQQMRENYSKMFENTPNLHCELKGRIVQNNIVIDKERVRFGKKYFEAVAIYHIENDKIKKVYFIQ
ncbi:amidohydrolase [Portibacter lacus]|uniref:Amidohydrolase n=2 Tax=Portibacter lacus TaxID=1099794 RepID=A0AA37WDA7_9BACT|nr:amidohydrolase [Portibacter lacus]